MLIEQWRWYYTTIRPHSALRYRPPAPAAILPDTKVPDYAVPQATTWGLATTPDSLTKGGPLRSSWSTHRAAGTTMIWEAIAKGIDTFTHVECHNYFAAAGYDRE